MTNKTLKRTIKASGLTALLASAAVLLTSCTDVDINRQRLERKVENYERSLENSELHKARDQYEKKVYQHEKDVEKNMIKSFYEKN